MKTLNVQSILCIIITSSAKQTLGIIRRNFRNVSVDCKSKIYNGLVRPKIEYANSAWYPYLQKDILYIALIWSNIQQLGFVSIIIPRNQE